MFVKCQQFIRFVFFSIP